MAGIGYGQSNADPAQGPVIDLPSFGDVPETPATPSAPLKLTISPPKKSGMTQESARQAILGVYDPKEEPEKSTGDFWDSLPDAEPRQTQGSEAPDTSATKSFWDSLPDAPPAKEYPKEPGYFEDLGKTIVGSTIPRAAASIPMLGANIGNLATNAVEGAGELGHYLFTGKSLSPEQRQQLYRTPFYSSEDALQAGAKATGLPAPYDPQWTANKYIDTAGQFVAGGKSIGAAIPKMAVAAPRLATAGIVSQAAEQEYPGNPIAPILGAVIGDQGAKFTAKAASAGKNAIGFGAKTQIAPGINATDYQMQRAAQNVHAAATNPQQVIADTGEQARPQPDMQGPMPQTKNAAPLIPGSNPTLAESTSDMGIAQKQDTLRTRNPTPFLGRVAEQGEARAMALQEAGGTGNPENMGKHLTVQLQAEDAARAAQEHAATANAASKGVALGEYGNTPGTGETNDVIQNAQGARKEALSKAWKILDPYKNSPADLGTLRKAALSIHDEVSQYGAQPLELPVSRITGEALRPPNPKTDNLGSLQRFRSAISDAQREVKSGSSSMRYLQILKNAVDEGIENTVNGLVDTESKAVAAGTMAPEDALHAYLKESSEQWYADRQSARGNLAVGDGRNAGRGSKAVSGPSGSKGPTGRGAASSPGSESVSPPFGAEQRAQYESARGLTFRHETLARLENSGAVNPDGTLDAAKYDRWYQKNKSLFKSNPEFGKELGDWRNAQEHLDNLRAENALKEKEFSKSRLSKIVNSDEPEKVIGKIFSSDTAVSEFADLVNRVKGDKAALEGLKNAVGQHLLKVAHADIAEEGSNLRSPLAFRKFLRNNNKSLRVVFGDEGLKNIEAIGQDIRRSQQLGTRTKIAGQSNTAKDALQAAKGNQSLLSKMMSHAPEILAVVSKLTGGSAGEGFLKGLPPKIANAFHTAGLKTIEDVEVEMMKNPAFANAMLRQVATKEIPLPLQRRIGLTILRPLPQVSAHENQEKNKSNH